MARPRDKAAQRQSMAFLEKCSREKEKLQARLANSLKADMLRMLDENIHPDICFIVNKQKVGAHKVMLKEREGDIYQKLSHFIQEQKKVVVDSVTATEFREFLRHLYTTECADIVVQEFFAKLSPPFSSQDREDGSQLAVGHSVHKQKELSSLSSYACDVIDSDDILIVSNYTTNNSYIPPSLPQSTSCLVDKSQESAENPPPDGGANTVIRQHDHFNNGLETGVVDSSICDKAEGDLAAMKCSQTKNRLEFQKLLNLVKVSYKLTLPYSPCSKLGAHLVQVLFQETDCDCIISVGEQDFKTHRCILASRSSYFSAMLNGSWVESDAEKISLEGINPCILAQVLFYLYGGVMDIIENCNIGDLLLTADMYGLEGLKEVIIFNLKVNKCHFFHKPCSICISGVPEVLVYSVNYGLQDLEDKCFKWINKNLTKVWPTKAFASLSESLLKLCCQKAVEHLVNCENVLIVIMDCQKLSNSLPRLKWTEPILDLITQLMDAAIEFTSMNFIDVISCENFMALGTVMAWSMTLLDEVFTVVIKSLPADKACRTYIALSRLNTYSYTEEECKWTEDFQKFVQSLFGKCEDYLKLHIHQIAHSKDWDLLTKDLQSKIMDCASYVCIDNSNRGKIMPPKLTSMQKKRTGSEVIKLLKDNTFLLPTVDMNSAYGRSLPSKVTKDGKSTRAKSASPSYKRSMKNETLGKRQKSPAAASKQNLVAADTKKEKQVSEQKSAVVLRRVQSSSHLLPENKFIKEAVQRERRSKSLDDADTSGMMFSCSCDSFFIESIISNHKPTFIPIFETTFIQPLDFDEMF